MDVLGSLVKPLIIAAFIAGLLAAAYSFRDRDVPYREKFFRNIGTLLGYSLPVALLGYVAGYLTGISRSPAVGTVIPAVLTLVAGFTVYAFDVGARNKFAVGFTVFIFAVLLYYGAHIGALDREYSLEARMTSLSQQEWRIRNFRKNLKLPEDLPGWITGVDSKK